jgi:antitoxin MazE6
MKTAVSVPDGIFNDVEKLVRRLGSSRSQVYTAALREYVARHAPDDVTEAMDRVCAKVGQPDEFVRSATSRVLETTEW